jgi:hypothetical protein
MGSAGGSSSLTFGGNLGTRYPYSLAPLATLVLYLHSKNTTRSFSAGSRQPPVSTWTPDVPDTGLWRQNKSQRCRRPQLSPFNNPQPLSVQKKTDNGGISQSTIEDQSVIQRPILVSLHSMQVTAQIVQPFFSLTAPTLICFINFQRRRMAPYTDDNESAISTAHSMKPRMGA